jgi:NAD(P)-dependent dehydrogenase (short-subunit alcohol dehydrogenase family)
VCATLAELGAHVVVAARDVAACRDAADDLVGRGLKASAHALDLADEDSIVALCAEVVEQHGALDVLVNNAVHRRGGTLAGTTAADWQATSDVNSRGLFLLCKHAVEHLAATGRGVVLNIASIYGMVGPDFAVYAGTDMTNPAFYAFDKGGMISFTRYLASWLGPRGVRVNCISPGGLRTADQPAPFVEAYCRRVPLGRLAGTEDIKGAVAFLASDASAYVTGINLPVDGGWTAV